MTGQLHINNTPTHKKINNIYKEIAMSIGFNGYSLEVINLEAGKQFTVAKGSKAIRELLNNLGR